MSLRRRKARQASVPMVAYVPPPTFWTSWPLFAWLIVTAAAWHFAGRLILLIAAVVLLVKGWIWLSWRFPRTMTFVNLFLAAMLNSGRGRRRW